MLLSIFALFAALTSIPLTVFVLLAAQPPGARFVLRLVWAVLGVGWLLLPFMAWPAVVGLRSGENYWLHNSMGTAFWGWTLLASTIAAGLATALQRVRAGLARRGSWAYPASTVVVPLILVAVLMLTSWPE